MSTLYDSNTRSLATEQIQRLLELPRLVGHVRPSREGLRRLAASISAVLGVKVAFARHARQRVIVLAESGPEPPLPRADADAWRVLEAVARDANRGAGSWMQEDRHWTVLRVATGRSPAAVLLLEGNWGSSAPMLCQLARTLFDREAVPSRMRDGVAAHRLGRVLAGVSGINDVCAAVLRHAIRRVPSRLGAFAVPAEPGRMAIVATHGYPLTLVQHVRIAPGTGVIGSVYQSGVALRVNDPGRVAGGHRRRSRYRTNTFVAIPATAAGETLGVLCLADRQENTVYTRDDMVALHALMTSASLALTREAARQQAEHSRHAAMIDPVSGLFNRRYFHSRLGEELERAQRHGMSVALLMVDIDDFKRINDSFGHAAGDTVIRDISEILRRSVRIFDVCTRYGGEEFAILMPGIGTENAASIAERIRQRMEEYRVFDPALATLRVTVSIGLAVSGGGSADELVEHADQALYAAKHAGKNRVIRASLASLRSGDFSTES